LILARTTQLSKFKFEVMLYQHIKVAAWYFMQQWLADFAYRIDLQWWVFIIAGAGALAVAFLTVGFQSVKAALVNPVQSLRSE
jgi:ABC-type antimicrobial peptide transport system permease subunit